MSSLLSGCHPPAIQDPANFRETSCPEDGLNFFGDGAPNRPTVSGANPPGGGNDVYEKVMSWESCAPKISPKLDPTKMHRLVFPSAGPVVFL